MSKRGLEQSQTNEGMRKRKKHETGDANVLVDLTNSQSHEAINPTERQRFFDSQHYKNTNDKQKENQRKFPGPAGVKKIRSNAKKTNEPPNTIRQSVFKDLTFICSPSDNTTWVAIKEWYNLHYGDKDNVLNKINIKYIQDKLRRVTPVDGRTPFPFLAAVIVDDGGLGTVPNLPEKKSCFSLILEDLTGSITALIDMNVVSHLGHLLRFGSSVILKNPQFYKVFGKPQISIIKEMVSCVAVNTKYIDLKTWRDTPKGFWPVTLENDIVIFEQHDIKPEDVNAKISEFENKIKLARRSLSATPTSTEKSHPMGSKTWMKVAHRNENQNCSPNATVTSASRSSIITKNSISKSANYANFDINTIEIDLIDAKKTDSRNDQNKSSLNISSLSISPKTTSCEQKKLSDQKNTIQIVGEFNDDSDDDLFNESVIVEKYNMNKKEAATNVTSYQSNATTSGENNQLQKPTSSVEIVGEFDDDSDDDLFNDSVIENVIAPDEKNQTKGQQTLPSICGDFGDNSDDDDIDLSLVQSLENFENQSLLQQANDRQTKDIVGDFGDEDDSEINSMLINVMEENSF